MTGATGFVGSHLVEALVGQGVPVRALVRPTSRARLGAGGAEAVEGSLEDAVALARGVDGADVVFHLAALTYARSAEEFERVNVQGTRAVVDAILSARTRPRRLVYLSSLAAVGPSRAGRPVRPEDPPAPLTLYGRTKLAGEQVCLSIAGEVEVVVLRAPAVYGPRDRELLRFFSMAKRGVLPVPGGTARPLQLIHVSDLAEALQRGATAEDAAGIYHVADPTAHLWEQIVRLIGRLVNPRARVVRIPEGAVKLAAALSEFAGLVTGRGTIFNRDKSRELLAPGWLCDTEAASRDLGFEARTTLEEGLAGTVEWYRANGWL